MKLESTSHLNLQQNSLRNGTVERGISGKEQGNFSSERTNRWVSAGKEVMRPSVPETTRSKCKFYGTTRVRLTVSSREHRPRSCADSTRRCDSLAGRDFRKGHEGYNSILSLAVVFNLCDRRFDTRSGRMTWHPMKK
jgi:hypothetical protein